MSGNISLAGRSLNAVSTSRSVGGRSLGGRSVGGRSVGGGSVSGLSYKSTGYGYNEESPIVIDDTIIIEDIVEDYPANFDRGKFSAQNDSKPSPSRRSYHLTGDYNEASSYIDRERKHEQKHRHKRNIYEDHELITNPLKHKARDEVYRPRNDADTVDNPIQVEGRDEVVVGSNYFPRPLHEAVRSGNVHVLDDIRDDQAMHLSFENDTLDRFKDRGDLYKLDDASAAEVSFHTDHRSLHMHDRGSYHAADNRSHVSESTASKKKKVYYFDIDDLSRSILQKGTSTKKGRKKKPVHDAQRKDPKESSHSKSKDHSKHKESKADHAKTDAKTENQRATTKEANKLSTKESKKNIAANKEKELKRVVRRAKIEARRKARDSMREKAASTERDEGNALDAAIDRAAELRRFVQLGMDHRVRRTSKFARDRSVNASPEKAKQPRSSRTSKGKKTKKSDDMRQQAIHDDTVEGRQRASKLKSKSTKVDSEESRVEEKKTKSDVAEDDLQEKRPSSDLDNPPGNGRTEAKDHASEVLLLSAEHNEVGEQNKDERHGATKEAEEASHENAVQGDPGMVSESELTKETPAFFDAEEASAIEHNIDDADTAHKALLGITDDQEDNHDRVNDHESFDGSYVAMDELLDVGGSDESTKLLHKSGLDLEDDSERQNGASESGETKNTYFTAIEKHSTAVHPRSEAIVNTEMRHKALADEKRSNAVHPSSDGIIDTEMRYKSLTNEKRANAAHASSEIDTEMRHKALANEKHSKVAHSNTDGITDAGGIVEKEMGRLGRDDHDLINVESNQNAVFVTDTRHRGNLFDHDDITREETITNLLREVNERHGNKDPNKNATYQDISENELEKVIFHGSQDPIKNITYQDIGENDLEEVIRIKDMEEVINDRPLLSSASDDTETIDDSNIDTIMPSKNMNYVAVNETETERATHSKSTATNAKVPQKASSNPFENDSENLTEDLRDLVDHHKSLISAVETNSDMDFLDAVQKELEKAIQPDESVPEAETNEIQGNHAVDDETEIVTDDREFGSVHSPAGSDSTHPFDSARDDTDTDRAFHSVPDMDSEAIFVGEANSDEAVAGKKLEGSHPRQEDFEEATDNSMHFDAEEMRKRISRNPSSITASSKLEPNGIKIEPNGIKITHVDSEDSQVVLHVSEGNFSHDSNSQNLDLSHNVDARKKAIRGDIDEDLEPDEEDVQLEDKEKIDEQLELFIQSEDNDVDLNFDIDQALQSMVDDESELAFGKSESIDLDTSGTKSPMRTTMSVKSTKSTRSVGNQSATTAKSTKSTKSVKNSISMRSMMMTRGLESAQAAQAAQVIKADAQVVHDENVVIVGHNGSAEFVADNSEKTDSRFLVNVSKENQEDAHSNNSQEDPTEENDFMGGIHSIVNVKTEESNGLNNSGGHALSSRAHNKNHEDYIFEGANNSYDSKVQEQPTDMDEIKRHLVDQSQSKENPVQANNAMLSETESKFNANISADDETKYSGYAKEIATANKTSVSKKKNDLLGGIDYDYDRVNAKKKNDVLGGVSYKFDRPNGKKKNDVLGEVDYDFDRAISNDSTNTSNSSKGPLSSLENTDSDTNSDSGSDSSPVSHSISHSRSQTDGDFISGESSVVSSGSFDSSEFYSSGSSYSDEDSNGVSIVASDDDSCLDDDDYDDDDDQNFVQSFFDSTFGWFHLKQQQFVCGFRPPDILGPGPSLLQKSLNNRLPASPTNYSKNNRDLAVQQLRQQGLLDDLTVNKQSRHLRRNRRTKTAVDEIVQLTMGATEDLGSDCYDDTESVPLVEVINKKSKNQRGRSPSNESDRRRSTYHEMTRGPRRDPVVAETVQPANPDREKKREDPAADGIPFLPVGRGRTRTSRDEAASVSKSKPQQRYMTSGSGKDAERESARKGSILIDLNDVTSAEEDKNQTADTSTGPIKTDYKATSKMRDETADTDRVGISADESLPTKRKKSNRKIAAERDERTTPESMGAARGTNRLPPHPEKFGDKERFRDSNRGSLHVDQLKGVQNTNHDDSGIEFVGKGERKEIDTSKRDAFEPRIIEGQPTDRSNITADSANAKTKQEIRDNIMKSLVNTMDVVLKEEKMKSVKVEGKGMAGWKDHNGIIDVRHESYVGNRGDINGGFDAVAHIEKKEEKRQKSEPRAAEDAGTRLHADDQIEDAQSKSRSKNENTSNLSDLGESKREKRKRSSRRIGKTDSNKRKEDDREKKSSRKKEKRAKSSRNKERSERSRNSKTRDVSNEVTGGSATDDQHEDESGRQHRSSKSRKSEETKTINATTDDNQEEKPVSENRHASRSRKSENEEVVDLQAGMAEFTEEDLEAARKQRRRVAALKRRRKLRERRRAKLEQTATEEST